MAQKQFHPFRIHLDIWLARFGSVLGWVWFVFWALIGVVGFGDLLKGKADNSASIVMPFLCLGLAALGILIVRACRTTKELVGQFRLFCAFFSHSAEKSIAEAAKALNIAEDTAVKHLEAMCKRGYFSGYLDHRALRMVFPADASSLTIAHCPGCGAETAIARSGDACRYCGPPLQT